MSDKSSSARTSAYKLGLVGRKVGMSRVYTEEGESIPVTVLDVSDNRITQIKSEEKDGYTAIQVTYGKRRPSRVLAPQKGHYAQAGVEAGLILKEFRLDAEQALALAMGSVVTPESVFKVNQKVDVQGITKGKGFAGTIKRHHFGAQRTSHGNSRSHRVPGSIGQAQDPGRVFPGKRMAGQLGNVTRTVQNLSIVRIDVARGLLFIKGAIPGPTETIVVVRPSVKTPLKKAA